MNKQLKQREQADITRPLPHQPRPHQPVIKITQTQPKQSYVKIILLIALLVEFMFAYSGVSIAHVLSYAIPVTAAAYLGTVISRSHGDLVGFLSGVLMIALYGYGFTVAQEQFLAIGASLQRIAVGGMFVTGILFLTTLFSRR